MKAFLQQLAVVAALLGLAATSQATVALSGVFGSHMVLQRGKPVPVSGTAAPNKAISVAFNGQARSTTSDAFGNWQVRLDPMAANTNPGTLTATEAGANTVTLTDVLVGDVWICSGQSNMAFSLSSCGQQADIDSANFPVMRQFRASTESSEQPLSKVAGAWRACSPTTAGGFSAVSFYFGRKLCQSLNSTVPIGLFVSSVGGTRIDPWLGPEGAADIPVLAPLYSQSILPDGPFCRFNGMIFPYAPLPAKGLIWYQGENGELTKQSPDSYYLKMKALSQGCKRMLGQDDLAFYFVQLANWGTLPTSPAPVLFSGGWDADTRLQQANAMALPHAGMASAVDVGETDNMHPHDKFDVGERLALWALKNDYGFAISETSGPVLKDVTVSGSTLVCSFDHLGGGLMVGSKTPYLPTTEVVGGTLQKFSISDASGTWYAASATIVGNSVVVSSPSVPNPRRVAYACWQNPVGANLYNRVGLPASPFYVDDVTAKFTVTAGAGSNGSISPAGTTSFLKRQTARYTITPNAGFYIQDVTVDGVSVGAVKSYTFDPLYASHTIAASFAASAPSFTVAASSTAGGTISPGGAVSVLQGGAQTFTVTPKAGTLTTLSVDGQPLGRRTSFTFGDVRESHTIAATNSVPIIAQSGYGGAISPTGETLVTYGTNRTFTITPASGFAIAQVTVDGNPVGAASSYTFTNVTAGHTITASFRGTGGAGSIPQQGQLYTSYLSDNLPASGPVSSWISYLPAGKTLTAQGTPTAEVIDGRKFVNSRYVDYDALDLGVVSSPIPCAGATIVVVAKPNRFGTDPASTSIVDVFFDRLALGILNGSGKVVVRRNGSMATSAAAIPDGQTTILSFVVQADGKYKVFANGAEVMNVTTTSDMTSIVPGVAGTFANHITLGRNSSNAWSTFNGYFGDCFCYTTALSDAERQQLEAWLVNRLTGTGSSTFYTLNASAGAGGAISPAGTLSVSAGASQTFTITPNAGYAIAGVSVDGSNVGAVGSYTFPNISADHSIAATFSFTGNTTPRAISINVGSNGALASTDVAGAVPVAHWNDLTGLSNPVSSALVNESGAPVAGMTASFQGTRNTFNSTGVPDRVMLSGFLSGSPMSVQLNNIPYARYDVYVYFSGFNNDNSYSLTWTATDSSTATLLSTRYSVRGSVGGVAQFPVPGLVESNFATQAEADAQVAAGNGGNWLKFTGLTAASLKIAEISSSYSNSNGFAGLQIVDATAAGAP